MLLRFISDESFRANYRFVIGIVLVAIVYFFINNTRVGYELRSVGYNKYIFGYGGINIKKFIIISMVISGLVAGLVRIYLFLGFSIEYLNFLIF